MEHRFLAGRDWQSTYAKRQCPQSLAIATAVVVGALSWGVVLCAALKFAAHIFAHPSWQIATEAISAAVMVWFAIRLLLHFP
jgi:threonine/homoserine/homoserine lactone efflux protein